MLRECARYEALAKIMLYSDDFFNFFRYVEVSTFDIASDAFSTFKVHTVYCVCVWNLNLILIPPTILINLYRTLHQELLTRHKMLCAEFLELNYDKVFSHYQRLLNSENYVTRRQSLKLLGELLLDRHNFTVSMIDILKIVDTSTSLFHFLSEVPNSFFPPQVMTRYISNPDNLKLMMNMLKEKSRNIQFEAFHVFKVIWCLREVVLFYTHV